MVCEVVGLAPRIHEPVRRHSRGMRLRLALAQALVPRPEIVVLDGGGGNGYGVLSSDVQVGGQVARFARHFDDPHRTGFGAGIRPRS